MILIKIKENNMLTIENTNKLFRIDVGEWRIGRVEEMNTSYIIQLLKPNGDKTQIMLERNHISSGDRRCYELWMWSKNPAYPPTPKRTMLKPNDIKDMNKLVSSMEFLIKP
jgi:hypothetical protein